MTSSERIDRLRRLLVAAVRARLALQAVGPLDAVVVPRRVEDIDVLTASTTELHELRAAVRPLARKLASRIGRQRRRHRHGSLDVRRTMRRSLDAGGIPLDPAWRRARRTKPQLVMLCDLSGSVAEFAHFTLMLLQAMSAELAGLRAFVFVDGVAEVTRVLEEAEVDLDPRLLVTVPGVVAGDGHSDYGRALGTFVERYERDRWGGDHRARHRRCSHQPARLRRRVSARDPSPVPAAVLVQPGAGGRLGRSGLGAG